MLNIQPIDAQAFYHRRELRRILPTISTQAIRSGKLRSSKVGTQAIVKGQWPIDWLEGKAQASSDHNAESVPA